RLSSILFHAARMLLVTRGEEPKKEAEVYNLFTRHFLDTGLIAKVHRPLLASASLICKVQNEVDSQKGAESFCDQKEQIITFGEDVTAWYRSMDNTMRFPGERENMVIKAANQKDTSSVTSVEQRAKPDRFKDLSGVQCPLNFAQIKVQLFAMSSGETLEVVLDDGAPIENVPVSVTSEGHSVLCQEKNGEQWTVLIQKS
ncbi:MAG: hypothetical protein D3925_10860, partial [Candidatus Electrothrix sp. AR5]|nr:hypothetical protein [Candidatus Electrothrix sp. AR5]